MVKKVKEAKAPEVAAVAEPEEKVTRLYEVMFILHPELLESKMKKKFKDFEDFVREINGVVKKSDLWGKRPLAYPVKKCREGFYGVYNLELSPPSLKELNQHLRVDTEVLRHLILSLPPDYVYQNYQEEEAAAEEEPRRKKERHFSSPSLKHGVPLSPQPMEEKKQPSQAVDEAALEKKLDQIIEGTDLSNL